MISRNDSNYVPRVLSIAGMDPIGAAGVFADIKTIHNHKVYAMGLITAITSQNTKGVYDVNYVGENIFKSQIDAIYDDIVPTAVKIGMLGSDEINNVIFNKLYKEGQKNVVFDPVMVSSSGTELVSIKRINFIRNKLMSIADLITPNKEEAQRLSGIQITSEADIEKAGKIILKNVRGSVLIKGGHINLVSGISRDYLFTKGEIYILDGKRLESQNTHGTGCLLSSAIASNLSMGKGLLESVRLAKKYLEVAISSPLDIGKGEKPVNHLAKINENNVK